MHPSDRRNRDFERIFVGSKCVTVAHFYSIGTPEEGTDAADSRGERFAFGYFGYDGTFRQGVTVWDGEKFNPKL